MVNRSSKSHDFISIARSVVEKSIGEQLDGKPLPDPNEGKNPAAVELGRLGGLKGGKARAAKLTAAKRSEIARNAAIFRWHRKKITDE